MLKATTRLVNQRTRRVDVQGRWGGEEFMVLLPESDLAAAMRSAERIRAAIAAHLFAHREPVTASFGVAVLAPDDRLDGLVKRADDALYLAKRSGRNRVESLLPEEPEGT